MSNKRINVTRSSMPEIEEYIEEIRPLWESRWLSNNGMLSRKFEEDLKKYLGCNNLCLFANGHSALEICLDTLQLKGEVITTPYTFVSTTHAIVRNGLKPVFVDIKEDNYTINPELIEDAITDNTVAIVATHVYGFLCDVKEIERIAKKHNLYVIFDAAHAFGVTLDGISVANFGDATMFSTHATKVFQTIEGGIVAYNNQEMFSSMAQRINFGYINLEEVKYISTNAKMNEFEAAMGICNLRHLNDEIAKRKIVGDRYTERLSGIKEIKLIKPEKGLKWNYAYFPVVFDGYKYSRDEIKLKLEKENIFARRYFYPITNQFECYKERYGSVNVPVADHISKCVLSLPMYADLSLDEVDKICDIILR